MTPGCGEQTVELTHPPRSPPPPSSVQLAGPLFSISLLCSPIYSNFTRSGAAVSRAQEWSSRLATLLFFCRQWAWPRACTGRFPVILPPDLPQKALNRPSAGSTLNLQARILSGQDKIYPACTSIPSRATAPFSHTRDRISVLWHSLPLNNLRLQSFVIGNSSPST